MRQPPEFNHRVRTVCAVITTGILLTGAIYWSATKYQESNAQAKANEDARAEAVGNMVDENAQNDLNDWTHAIVDAHSDCRLKANGNKRQIGACDAVYLARDKQAHAAYDARTQDMNKFLRDAIAATEQLKAGK
jgi:hypothetical protein